MTNLSRIIDNSAVIINGYALQNLNDNVRVVNIHRPGHVTVFSKDGKVMETSMDDIELHIARSYLEKGLHYMEDDDAEVL